MIGIVKIKIKEEKIDVIDSKGRPAEKTIYEVNVTFPENTPLEKKGEISLEIKKAVERNLCRK